MVSFGGFRYAVLWGLYWAALFLETAMRTIRSGVKESKGVGLHEFVVLDLRLMPCSGVISPMWAFNALVQVFESYCTSLLCCSPYLPALYACICIASGTCRKVLIEVKL